MKGGDKGFWRENKQGAQWGPRGGGGGGAGEVHVSAGPALEASRPRYREEYGVFDLVGEGRLRGTGSGKQHSEQKEGAGLSPVVPEESRAWPAWGRGRARLLLLHGKARCEHFEVAKQGGWGFSACLTAGVKERCVEPSPALIL